MHRGYDNNGFNTVALDFNLVLTNFANHESFTPALCVRLSYSGFSEEKIRFNHQSYLLLYESALSSAKRKRNDTSEIIF